MSYQISLFNTIIPVTDPSMRRLVQTTSGPIFIQKLCSTVQLEYMHPSSGLHAFARTADREYQLLLNIARTPENELTLAYTPAGEIVGEVTLAPVDSWWDALPHIREIGLQVSSSWRGQGLAHELLASALDREALEQQIIIAMGLTWHWDFKETHYTRTQYRELLARLFSAYGFAEYLTSEPNIKLDPDNIFLARIGKHVKPETINSFFSRVLNVDNMFAK